jgi:hypothetical protein
MSNKTATPEEQVNLTRQDADLLAKTSFMKAVAIAGDKPTPPSVICPLRHYHTGKPLIRYYYSVDEAGVPHVRGSTPRHSSLDLLILRLPSVRLRSEGLERLEGYGFNLTQNFIRGTLTAKYGPISLTIRARLKGNLRDPGRRTMEHEWTLNPSWFVDFSSISNLGTLIFENFDPNVVKIIGIDCASDYGLPGTVFKSFTATDTKIKGTMYDNGLQATRGMYNGWKQGAGDDQWRYYDKRHQLMYRKPEVRETLADVPWVRLEHMLRGKKLPIKTLADLSDLINFDPFGKQEYRMAHVHASKVTRKTAHYRALFKKLFTFESVMERESQVRAVRALNGQGHFRQLVKRGYITLQPVPLNPTADWRSGIEGFFSPGGGLTFINNPNDANENEYGYF